MKFIKAFDLGLEELIYLIPLSRVKYFCIEEDPKKHQFEILLMQNSNDDDADANGEHSFTVSTWKTEKQAIKALDSLLLQLNEPEQPRCTVHCDEEGLQ